MFVFAVCYGNNYVNHFLVKNMYSIQYPGFIYYYYKTLIVIVYRSFAFGDI